MSYQVIARKYRPQRFADVVGQEHVTHTLSQAIAQHRIAHAYLFCGPRGTGKTTVARIFAKCLNCTDGPKVDFSDSDPRCKEITEGRALDVLEIDGASNNGVEQVRELRETCQYVPASSRFKIYIIDEVHMLSTAAFNALLKTLEEPPAHVKFMFATTDPEKVLPTILSRCQRFDLRRIPTALISKHLAHIAAQEKVTVEPPALHAIARGAEGGMRDAESALDQLISFCGEHIQESDVLSMFGLTAQGQLLDLARAVLDGKIEPALRVLNELAGHGKDLGRLVTDLLNHFRNLLIYRVSGGDLSMLEASEAESSALAEQASLATLEGLTRILEIFGETEMRLGDAASKKILIEIALLKAVEARQAVSLDTVLRQLRALGSQAGTAPAPTIALENPHTTPAVAPARKASPAPASAPAPAAQLKEPATPAPRPNAPTPAGTDLQGLWTRLIEAVGRVSLFTRSYLVEAHPVSLTKNLLTIGFDPQFEDHMGLVDNARNHEMLQTKLAELGHPGLQIKFVKAEAPARATAPVTDSPAVQEPTLLLDANAATSAPSPAPRKTPARSATAPSQSPAKEPAKPATLNKEDFKNDPLIQKALELFRGQIVDVRG